MACARLRSNHQNPKWALAPLNNPAKGARMSLSDRPADAPRARRLAWLLELRATAARGGPHRVRSPPPAVVVRPLSAAVASLPELAIARRRQAEPVEERCGRYGHGPRKIGFELPLRRIPQAARAREHHSVNVSSCGDAWGRVARVRCGSPSW